MPSCKFCGATEKLTGEHVFPNWIRNAVGDGGAHFFRRKPNGQVDEWQTVAYSTTVRDVCATCNNGWMKKIEDSTAPLLPQMLINGTQVNLNSGALVSIATWVTLRSLVVPLAAGPDDVPISMYRTIEQTHRAMDQSKVWLGRLEGTDARTAFFLGATLNIENTTPKEADAYVATMAIGQLATRVFVLTPGRGTLGQVSNDPFDPFLIDIWPGVNGVTWPPQSMDVGEYTQLNRILPKAWVALNLR